MLIQIKFCCNYSLHWSLIVICHPGEVVNFDGEILACDLYCEPLHSQIFMLMINVPDNELDKSLKVPCILHMDSIKGSHSGLKNLVQRYIRVLELLICVHLFLAHPKKMYADICVLFYFILIKAFDVIYAMMDMGVRLMFFTFILSLNSGNANIMITL